MSDISYILTLNDYKTSQEVGNRCLCKIEISVRTLARKKICKITEADRLN